MLSARQLFILKHIHSCIASCIIQAHTSISLHSDNQLRSPRAQSTKNFSMFGYKTVIYVWAFLGCCRFIGMLCSKRMQADKACVISSVYIQQNKASCNLCGVDHFRQCSTLSYSIAFNQSRVFPCRCANDKVLICAENRERSACNQLQGSSTKQSTQNHALSL